MTYKDLKKIKNDLEHKFKATIDHDFQYFNREILEMGVSHWDRYGINSSLVEVDDDPKIYFESVKKEIEHLYVKTLNHLKLPLISLNFGVYKTEHDTTFFGEFCTDGMKHITVNLIDQYEHLEHFLKTSDMRNKDFHIMTMFHEVGHYYHYHFHNTHWTKYRKKYRINLFPEAYRKQNIEKHANNIARALYKRLYK